MALASNALTTVETLCGELDIAVPTGAALTSLERRIAVASSAIEAYCNRTFGTAAQTEAVAGFGTDVLRVSRAPVTAIASISLDGFTLDAESYSCTGEDARLGFIRAAADYVAWEDTARWQSGGAPEKMAGTETLAYSVTYTAGYVLPQDATEESPATLPPEVEEACLLACVASYRAKGRDSGISSETLLNASVSYRDGGGLGESGLPVAAEAMLKRYRREF